MEHLAPAGLSGPEGLRSLLFYVCLAILALLDLRVRRVPNSVSVPFLLAGVAGAGLVGGGAGALASLGGAAVGLGMLIVPFSLRMVGGGDVKALAAMGAWLGPAPTVFAAAWGFVAGGVIAVLLVLPQRELRRDVWVNLRFALLTQALPDVGGRPAAQSVPHVTAFAIGGALTRALAWGT